WWKNFGPFWRPASAGPLGNSARSTGRAKPVLVVGRWGSAAPCVVSFPHTRERSVEKQRLSDDDQEVQNALDYLKQQTAIPVTMYGEVKSPKKLQIVNWIGLRTPALENLEIVNAAGVGGRVMATRRPVGVSDYTRAKAISHEYDSLICDEGLHSLVAVP